MKAKVGFLPFFGSYVVMVGEKLVYRTKDKQEAIKKAQELNASEESFIGKYNDTCEVVG